MITDPGENRMDQVAEERAVVYEEETTAMAGTALGLALEPVVECEREEVADVEHLGGALADDGRAEEAGHLGGQLDLEPVLDDVDDLVDEQTHGPPVLGEYQHRLGLALGAINRFVHVHKRDEAAAVEHHRTAAGMLDLGQF